MPCLNWKPPSTTTFMLNSVRTACCNVELGISDRGFLFFILCFYFWVKKIKTCWIYKNTVFAKWGKYRVSWNFFGGGGGVKNCIPGSFDTVTSLSMGFCRERAVAGQGPSGLRFFRHKHSVSAISYLLVVADVVVVFPTLQSEEIPLLQKM